MSLTERANEFKAAIEKNLPAKSSISGPMLGFSNQARLYEDHFFLGGPNLVGFLGGFDPKNLTTEPWEAFVLTSCVSPVLGIELHIGVAVTTSTAAFRNKIIAVANARVAKGETPGHNNTLLTLSKSGELLIGIGKEDAPHPSGIKPEKFYIAVYPGDSRTRLNPAVQEFIGSIQELIGAGNVHRVDLWAGTSITEEMRRMPKDIPFAELEKSVISLRGHYSTELLKRFHNGLNFHPNKHFAILSGISGSGKTSLVRRYACAVHGIKSDLDNDPLFFWCRVRPDWTDPSGILGHFDVFSGKYTVPPFLEALLAADAYPSSPVFVCLDEMNLARVEYYLADVLSAMETPTQPLQLHTNAQAFDGDAGVKVPKTMKWPSNLFIIGTINIDETTTLPSPKVLDRAVVIDMSDIDVSQVLAALELIDAKTKWAVSQIGSTIKKLHAVLKTHQLAFGYRAIEEVVRYLAFSAIKQTSDEAVSLLDEQLNQKVLTKLRGTHEQAAMIADLKALMAPMKLCAATIERLEQELEETGSFQAMR